MPADPLKPFSGARVDLNPTALLRQRLFREREARQVSPAYTLPRLRAITVDLRLAKSKKLRRTSPGTRSMS
jgi:hypothetical protein